MKQQKLQLIESHSEFDVISFEQSRIISKSRESGGVRAILEQFDAEAGTISYHSSYSNNLTGPINARYARVEAKTYSSRSVSSALER